MKSFCKKAFRKPENVFYPGFFWMWNKKLEREELFATMDDMVAHDSRAVCIHPLPQAFRPGSLTALPGSYMIPDYLSDEYLKLLSDVMDYAEKIGMVPWLYDEGGWPSGSACGKVLAQNPEGFARQHYVNGPNGPELALDKGNPAMAAPYPSVIENGVTEQFISLTHEVLKKYLFRHFSKTILFAFTDEPDMSRTTWGQNLGWSSDFAEEFLKRKQYDITPFIPRLLKIKKWDNLSESLQKVRIDYCDVRSQLFNERYMRPLRDWCRANGLLSGGHLNCEDQPEMNDGGGHGHILRAMRNLDVPGVDVIWRQLFPNKSKDPETQLASSQFLRKDGLLTHDNAPFPKYASSTVHQNGGRYALSESFAIYGDGLSPDEMKWLVDYEMVRGITLFVFSSYSPDNAGAKMAAGPHFGKDDPFWPFMKPFFTYIARVTQMLSLGKPAVRTAVLYDIRGIWAGGKDEHEAIRKHYEVSRTLLQNCCDFDYIDDDQLAAAKITPDGTCRIGKMEYDTIVLPTSKWIQPKAKNKLLRLLQSNFRILDASQLDQVPPICRVTGGHGKAIRVCKRLSDQSALYFFTNESTVPQHVRITLEETDNIVLCDPMTGKYLAIHSCDGSFAWDFSPCGSALFLTNVKPDSEIDLTLPGRTETLHDWTLRPLARHAPGKTRIEVTPVTDAAPVAVAPGDWRPILGEEFSGTALYECDYSAPGACRVQLDLGRVCHCASVKINGRQLEDKFFGPFTWTVELQAGRNHIEVTIANALVNAMSPKHVRDYIETTFPPRSPYEPRVSVFNQANHESGLYGPVTLQFLRYTNRPD